MKQDITAYRLSLVRNVLVTVKGNTQMRVDKEEIAAETRKGSPAHEAK